MRSTSSPRSFRGVVFKTVPVACCVVSYYINVLLNHSCVSSDEGPIFVLSSKMVERFLFPRLSPPDDLRYVCPSAAPPDSSM